MPSNEISIQVRGVEDLRLALKQYPSIARPIIQRALDDSGRVLLKTVQLLPTAFLPQRSGKLRSSFTYARLGMAIRFYPGDNVPWAIFVHQGTKAHIIRARNARALAFQWDKRGYGGPKGGKQRYQSSRAIQSGGGVQFVTGKNAKLARAGNATVLFEQVHHPGTKAHPFMPIIVKNATPEINVVFRKALDNINAQIAALTRNA